MSDYHLAQFNFTFVATEPDNPVMDSFYALLDEVNAAAEAAQGFVWRLKDDELGNATNINPVGDPRALINMSVWESIEALKAYTYSGDHVDVFRRRKEWFIKHPTLPQVVMWWIAAGHITTPEEGYAKIQYLGEHGPTPLAFTFKQTFTVEDMLAATPH